MTATWYEVLGVDPTATADELRRAYLAQARRHHPDAGGDGPAMTRLNEAWAVLSDPHRRRSYDCELGVTAAPRPPVEGHGPDARLPFDADPADLLDATPFSTVGARPSLALVPPGLFATSIVTGCVAMVLGSPPMLGAAGVLFFLSCVSIAAVAMWTLRGSARR